MHQYTTNENFTILNDFLQNQFNIDLNNYQSHFILRRLHGFLLKYHFQDTQSVIHRLTIEKHFINYFLNEISLPENDFFRDPEIWKILILEIIPSVLKQKDHVHIYFPDFCSGIEIISLLILLKDYNLSPKVRIYADTFTLKQLQNIECRQFSKEMFNYYRDNYKNVNPDFELSDNFISIGKFFNINPVIYNEISLNLSEHKLNTQIPNILYDIIIYRNKLLYYNIDYCNSIINQLSDNLEINGFFITGTKDILLNRNFSNRLKLINFEERIYIKIK